MKVSDYVAATLFEHGISTIFGFQGSNVTHLVDSINKTDGLSYIQNHHEQASAFAACAYSSVKNDYGCALASSGPGAINMISGIANAWLDSLPVVFITGQLNTKSLRTDNSKRQHGFQEFDIVSTVKDITKYSVTVKDEAEIRYHLEKALYLAKDGRNGGVLLDIPHNIQTADVDISSLRGFAPEHNIPLLISKKSIEDSITLIESSKRPLVLVGGGAKELKKNDFFSRFLYRLDMPVVASLNGLDILPHSYENFFGFIGSYGNRFANIAVHECDLLIVLGSRLDMRQTGDFPEEFAKNAKIIRVDIDPHELSGNVNPDISVYSRCIDYIKAILDCIKGCPGKNAEWLQRLRSLRENYPVFSKDDPKTYPNEIIHLVSCLFKGNDVITADVGQNQMWTAQSVFLKDNMRLLNSAGLGSMGFSLPASIGASFTGQNSHILCVSGDGGIQMNIQELMTVSRENLPVKILILNNRSLGLIRTYQSIVFKNDIGSVKGFSSPDYELLAKSYGIRYASIEKASDILKIRPEISDDLPLLIEVKLSYDTEVHPEPAYMKPVYIQSPLLEQ